MAYTFSRFSTFQPSNLNLATNTVMGTTQRVTLDRTWPIEEIVLFVSMTVGATAISFNDFMTGPVGCDGILGVIKRVNLTVNDPIAGRPRTVVDYSGIGLLEYGALVGLNLGRSTLDLARYWQLGQVNPGGMIPANSVLRYEIRIPLVHPLAAEPLRTRMLLPVHLYQQDPVLTIDFANNATGTAGSVMGDLGIGNASGVLAACNVEIGLVRRSISADVDAQILKTGGYIETDLLELQTSFGAGTSGEQRIPLNLPGFYMNVCNRQYLGGTLYTREVLDQAGTALQASGAGVTSGPAIQGSETRWRLETGGNALRDWKWKHVQYLNDLSRPVNGVSLLNGGIVESATVGIWTANTSAGAVTQRTDLLINPSLGSAPPNTAVRRNYMAPASTMLDFVSDGIETFDELGSVLDCFSPSTRGLKMEIIGNIQSVTGNSSVMFTGGHRITSPNITPYLAVR